MLAGAALPTAARASGPETARSREDAEYSVQPIPLAAAAPEGNVLTRVRIGPGKTLFFDPRLSRG